MELNNNNLEIEEVKPFIDVERVPKLLWLSLLIPGINSIAFYIIFKYGNNFAKALGILLIILSIIFIVTLLNIFNKPFFY